MKILGIIGGIGPESTIEYYRGMIAAHRRRCQDGSYPAIVINSIDMRKMLGLIAANELAQAADYLAAEVGRLAAAGAERGLLAANTPHIVFDEIQRRSPIPLVSIVEAACHAAKEMGLARVGLFGTRFTMQGRFYPYVFSREGITVAAPARDEQEFIHGVYMNELVKGIFRQETRERLLSIADRMKQRDLVQGIILGGTELPLILRDVVDRGMPFLDTTQIHVARLFAEP